jgi:hypothetical protein
MLALNRRPQSSLPISNKAEIVRRWALSLLISIVAGRTMERLTNYATLSGGSEIVGTTSASCLR